MIVFDISCDICRQNRVFPLGTRKREMYKTFHHIKKKDICSDCVTLAIHGIFGKVPYNEEGYYIPYNVEIIGRDLTKSEEKKVIKFYDL